MYAIMKIYFVKDTGEVIHRSSYEQEVEVSFDSDYNSLIALNQRAKNSIGFIILRDGQYEQDFRESNGVRVNPETLELEFSYPDPNEPEEPPVFQKPLTEQILELKEEQDKTKRMLSDSYSEQQLLIELLIDMGVL